MKSSKKNTKKKVSKKSVASVEQFLGQNKRNKKHSLSRSQQRRSASDNSDLSDDGDRSSVIYKAINANRKKTWKPLSASTMKLLNELMDTALMSALPDVSKSEGQDFQEEWDTFKIRLITKLKNTTAPSAKINYEELAGLCSSASRSLEELVQLVEPLEESIQEHMREIEDKEQQLVDLERLQDRDSDNSE